ncbi:MAG: NHL repeat-containing protein [bacterium]|nr:NHL repeat-containing protein [bacterium]
MAILLLSIPCPAGVHFSQTAEFHPPYNGFTPRSPVAFSISPADFIYLLDQGSSAVARLRLDGLLLNQFGGPGSGTEQFSDPTDVCAVSGLDVFVADRGNDRVVRMNRELHYLAEFRSLDGTAAELAFERPLSVLSGPRGDLFIADGGNDRILKMDPSGGPVFSFGDFGESRGSLLQPRRLELDPKVGFWVLDARGQVVHFDEYGSYLGMFRIDTVSGRGGLAVASDAVWVCGDSLLWRYDLNEPSLISYSRKDLGLPADVTLIDLVFRKDQLWILDAAGSLYCLVVTVGR